MVALPVPTRIANAHAAELKEHARKLRVWHRNKGVRKSRVRRKGRVKIVTLPIDKPETYEAQLADAMPTMLAIRDRQHTRFGESYSAVSAPQRLWLKNQMRRPELLHLTAVEVALLAIRHDIYELGFDPLLVSAAVDIDEPSGTATIGDSTSTLR